jgi:hypothetical protein
LATGASNGPVKAILTEGLTISGEELIEPEAVLLGTGQSTEERLFIHFDKVVFKDGSMASIQADAADSSDKTPGLKGSKVGQYALRLGERWTKFRFWIGGWSSRKRGSRSGCSEQVHRQKRHVERRKSCGIGSGMRNDDLAEKR